MYFLTAVTACPIVLLPKNVSTYPRPFFENILFTSSCVLHVYLLLGKIKNRNFLIKKKKKKCSTGIISTVYYLLLLICILYLLVHGFRSSVVYDLLLYTCINVYEFNRNNMRTAYEYRVNRFYKTRDIVWFRSNLKAVVLRWINDDKSVYLYGKKIVKF